MQVETASRVQEREAAIRKLACACNELAIFDFVFYIDNPGYYNDEQSWLVVPLEGAPSKHTAMIKCAVSLFLPSPNFATLKDNNQFP